MRLNYFGYYIEDENTNSKYLYDLRKFLNVFCQHSSVPFKRSFELNGENIYLFHSIGDLYLFVTTRSHEIIKRINSENLDVQEIYTALSENENLGFVSYLYLDANYICFSSTMFSPKINSLTIFINELFKRINIDNFKIKIQALLYQSTRSEVLNMPFIGKTTIELTKQNSFTKDFLAIVGCDVDEDTIGFESFEIVIKPKRRQNVEKIAKKFLSNIPDAGMEKFITKAKEDTSEALTDLYLVGKGAISDNIIAKDEHDIYEKIIKKKNENRLLPQKIKEFSDNGYLTENIPAALLRFNLPDSWTGTVYTVQDIDEA